MFTKLLTMRVTLKFNVSKLMLLYDSRTPVMETAHQNHVDAVCAGQECVALDMVDGKRPNEAVPDITGQCIIVR